MHPSLEALREVEREMRWRSHCNHCGSPLGEPAPDSWATRIKAAREALEAEERLREQNDLLRHVDEK